MVVLLAAACNGGAGTEPGTDLLGEDTTVADTWPDTPFDTLPDTPLTDTPSGPPEDTPYDTAPDTLPDTPEDTPADTPSDTAPDTLPDALEDTAYDTPPDTPLADTPLDTCSPACDGKDCGDDGCGGTCGACDDGDLCNGVESCEDGLCVAGAVLTCDDGNPCTDEDCDPSSGCFSVPNAGPCDDGIDCTDGDHCVDGGCVGGENVCECESGDDCPAWADPDDLCAGELVCDTGAFPYSCVVDPGTVVTCDSGLDTACTQQVCDPQTGQCGAAPANEGGPCDDGVPCTGPDACLGGVCVGDDAGCEEFSIVLLPDTQYYAKKMPNDSSNTYYKQTQWIVDHQDEYDIQMVIHLGDITHDNTTSEWVIADNAHAILDAAGVPYTIVPGNHDYAPLSNFSRGQTKLNDWFGPDRFAGAPWYGGSYFGKSDSNYAFFEVGSYEFMVISLEHAPRKDVLCWAADLIAAHPQRRVILVTHCYLTHNGNHSSSCATGYDTPGSSGLTLWEELASQHSNVFMVLCGHVGDSEHVPTPGNAGNTVHQMLVDYQFEATCTGGSCSNKCQSGFYTGNGWLRRLTFAPATNQVHAETWSVEDGNPDIFPGGDETLFCSSVNTNGKNHYDPDPAGPDHTFSFAYDLTSPMGPYQSIPAATGAFMDRTVNSAGGGDQLEPVVAMNAAGDLVVAWEDDSSDTDGGGNHDVFARGFEVGGCERFDDIVAHDVTAGHQGAPALGMDAAGGFVVAFRDDKDGNGLGQIYAWGFDGEGDEAFSVVSVNSVDSGEQRNPAIGVAPDGTFVVAWEDDSDGSDGSGNYDIYARVFHPGGSEKVIDLVVNQVTAGQQRAPAVAIAPTGEFVVTWEDDNDGNGKYQIYARGFSATGAPTFGPFTVNSVATGQQRAPVIAMDGTGGFVIAWEDDSDSSDGSGNYDIYARGFDAQGAEVFPDILVNASPAGQQLAPAIARRPGGGFVVVWEDDSDDNGWYQVYARGFTAVGTQAFAEKTVNTENEGQQLMPSVGVDGDGLFVVAWQDDMDKNGVGQIMARGLDW